MSIVRRARDHRPLGSPADFPTQGLLAWGPESAFSTLFQVVSEWLALEVQTVALECLPCPEAVPSVRGPQADAASGRSLRERALRCPTGWSWAGFEKRPQRCEL